MCNKVWGGCLQSPIIYIDFPSLLKISTKCSISPCVILQPFLKTIHQFSAGLVNFASRLRLRLRRPDIRQPIPIDIATLQVDVAHERALRIDNLSNRRAPARSAHLQPIIERAKRRRRVVEHEDAAANGILPRPQILVLPDPPRAIDLCVVQPEHRVTWGDEEVSAGVAADGVVTGGMDAVEAVLEGHAVDDALHDLLEGRDVVVVLDQVCDLLVGAPARGDPLADVAGETAWLVGEEVGGRHLCGVRGGGRGGDVDDEVLEGAGCDAAAAGSWRDAVYAGGEGVGAVVGREDAVAAHGVVGAVEVWRVDRVRSGLAPVPVLSCVLGR